MTKKLMCKWFGCKNMNLNIDDFIKPLKSNIRISICRRCGRLKKNENRISYTKIKNFKC